jgi:hypothetical protein
MAMKFEWFAGFTFRTADNGRRLRSLQHRMNNQVKEIVSEIFRISYIQSDYVADKRHSKPERTEESTPIDDIPPMNTCPSNIHNPTNAFFLNNTLLIDMD